MVFVGKWIGLEIIMFSKINENKKDYILFHIQNLDPKNDTSVKQSDYLGIVTIVGEGERRV
jgi:hypothetical protein